MSIQEIYERALDSRDDWILRAFEQKGKVAWIQGVLAITLTRLGYSPSDSDKMAERIAGGESLREVEKDFDRED